MRMRIIVFAVALSALPGTAFALCQSNINGGTTLNEGECYMHSVGVAVGCHGGVLAPVGGTTNKCKAWIKVERPATNSVGGSTPVPDRGSKAPAFSSGSAIQKEPAPKN